MRTALSHSRTTRAAQAPARRSDRTRPGWSDGAALLFLSVVSFLYLSPSLKDGSQFVPSDIGEGFSLLTKLLPAAPPLHNDINSDIVRQTFPAEIFNWRTVHSGALPLWNGLVATGLPHLFNFQSAPLSLPSLVSYLVPLSWVSLTIVAMKLLIAGTGVYFCSRVLGTGTLGAAFAGLTFMLSGSFAGWLGWAISGPLAWSGWILGSIIVCARTRSRVWPVFLLAMSVAFSLYGGFPEASLLTAIGLGAATGTMASFCVLRRTLNRRGALRAGIGIVAGVALASPLLLPGFSVISSAARNGTVSDSGLSLHAATLLFTQGYYGLPIVGSISWQNYYETAAYVGVGAIVLALVGVMVCWRRPATIGLVAGGGICFLTVYRLGPWAPIQRLYGDVGLSAVALQRVQAVLAMFIALLAGLGLDQLVRRLALRRVRIALLVATTAVAAAVGALWIGVDGARVSPAKLANYRRPPSLGELEAVRRASLLWPTSIIVFLVVSVGIVLALRDTHDRLLKHLAPWLAIALLSTQSAFLVVAGVGLNSYAHVAYPITPAVASLKKIVGSHLLGLDSGNVNCATPPAGQHGYCGVREWSDNGFYPEINVAYGLRELAAYDPTIPQSYFDAWPIPNAAQRSTRLRLFSPDIDSVALARRYGVRYVLALPGEATPAGMTLVAHIRGEALYSVPGAKQFSFKANADAMVRASAHPSDNRYVVSVLVRHHATLQAKITAATGWHAVADGRPLPLRRSAEDFLQIGVPAGTTSISLFYWPRSFTIGLLLAAAALAGFVVWVLMAEFGRRRTWWW